MSSSQSDPAVAVPPMSREQRANARNALIAGFLGWTLDAFDFFILVLVLDAVAKDFHRPLTDIAFTLTTTLAMRPVGAFIFGVMADRYGRRLPLMLDVVFYSIIEVLSGLAPTYKIFLILRLLYGIGMGGVSHGTQDMYPTFLKKQLHFSVQLTSVITIVSMIGAIVGGLVMGLFSDRFGRRRAMIISVVLAMCFIPLWVGVRSVPMIFFGAFLMQFMVQGAWGVIPAHINELSPGSLRGFFPGFAYQMGVLCASGISYVESV